MNRVKSKFKQMWLRFRCGFANALRGIQTLFSLAFVEHPHFSFAGSGPCLVPKHPESIWLNCWQAGWMLRESGHTEPDLSAEYDDYLDQ